MNRSILHAPLLLLPILSLLVTFGLNAQETKLISEVEGISEYRLSNGVQALLFPDSSKPNFTVNMTVLVGSRHEGYGETGMAHLLEHMLFKGTPTHNDIPALLKDRGVLNLNGTTWLDRTNYFETLPAKDDNLEFAIKMEADRLLNSTIKGEDLLSEMTVVRNEFEMGENSPASILMQRLMATAYEWHNYGKSTIGNRSDIERVPLDNLRRFYSKYYQPDNIMVVVAGKFEQKEALELLEKYFGSLKVPDRELPKTYTEEPIQDGERLVVLRRVGDVQMAGVGYHIPAAADPDFVTCEVLSQILGLEPGGLLYKKLVESGMASSANAFIIPGHDPGMLLTFCEVSKEKDLEAAKQLMLETIESVGANGVSEDDVKRAVQRLLKDREQTFASTEAMAIELSEWRAYGDWRLYFLHRDRLEKVTAADVQRVAKTWLLPSNRTVGLFIPTADPVRTPVASQPKVKELVGDYKGRAKIAAGESFEPTPENIDSRLITGELTSGLKIALLPKKTRDSRVNVSGKLDFGTLDSLRGNSAVATLMGSMLSRGTQQLSFQEFRDKLDSLRATLSFNCTPGSLGFAIQTKRENLPEVLKLLEQALKTPAFSASELDIVRREAIAQMETMKSDPQGLAGSEFARTFAPYEQDDPRYAPTIDESIERMKAVTVEQIRELHSRFISGQHGQIAVVGDFDPEATREGMDKLFAGWTTKEPFARIPRPAVTDLAGKRMKINTPDKANAIYIAGMMLPLRDDNPDAEALAVANYVLGGGPLASRLADRVRKKEGLSYGVGSMVQSDSQDERSMLLMFAISNPENTEKVVSTIDEEVSRFVDSGVQAEELNNAISSYLETRKGSRANDGQLAGLLVKNLETGRTMKFQAESDQRIRLLTKERVDAVIKQLLDKQRLIIITAGDFEKANAAAGEGEKK